MWVELGVLVFGVVASYYMYCRHAYSRFARMGVKNVEPVLFFGNFAASTIKRKNVFYVVQELYNAFPEEKYIGVFESLNPMMMIRDPELIRQVTVKEFDHFVDHRVFINQDVDPLFARSLFALKSQKWRDMRSTLRPAFTGSKMRGIYPLMVECAQQVVEYLEEQWAKADVINGERLLDVEARDMCTRYANDVIASATFGLRVNSIRERENEFYVAGHNFTRFSFWVMFKQFILISAPKISKMFKLRIFSSKLTNFFRNMVNDTMRYREEKGIYRADMINILMDAKKGTLQHQNNVASDNDVGFATVEESSDGKQNTQRKWEDDDIVAQAFLFFFAGFDTTSNAMTFSALELTNNPDVQTKLAAEVDQVFEEGNELTFEIIQKLKYLDMVISEVLRKWPPASTVDRLCNKPFVLEPMREGGKPVRLNQGDMIFLPLAAIQRDPKYWPEPELFDPERFSDDNKSRIQPFTYLPFGSGPRNCIGSRFALLEVKILICYLVRHFELLPGPKTPNPIILEPIAGFQLRIKDGSWLRLKPRNPKA